MIVCPAQPWDMARVDALRQAYFAASALAVQERGPRAVWWIALDRTVQIVGCCCLEDVPQLKQRWLLDCYAVPGWAGKRALVAMYAHIKAGAVRDGLKIVGMCQPGNTRQIQAYLRRGGQILGLMIGEP